MIEANGLNLIISVTIPIPTFSLGAWIPAIPTIKLPDLPNVLKWLGDHIQELINLILKLIDMIPEASVRLKIYIKTAAAKTKIFDETVGI